MKDPERLLAVLAECVPDAHNVTLVFDVASDRGLRLVDVRPHISYADGMNIIQKLNADGVRRWWPEEHAALTDAGWIDVEALDGD